MNENHPHLSTLLDHLYGIKSTQILKDLIQKSPFLAQFRRHAPALGENSGRAKPLLDDFTQYPSSASQPPSKHPRRRKVNKGKDILTNEFAGLILLAMDIAQPWSCHQKYKVMDELHSDIFGRPDVTGAKVLGYWECFKAVESALDSIEDKHFAYYNLTKYFLAYAVVSLIRTETAGVKMLNNMKRILTSGRLDELVEIFGCLAKSLAFDLNAEVVGEDAETFDYKNELKSPTWCKKISARLVAQYSKDVMRKKADSIDALCSGLSVAE